MARTEVRMAEIRDSLRFVFDLATEGDLAAPPPAAGLALGPDALGVGWVEAPEGEWLAVVETGPDGTITHARVRPASLLNFGCFQRACEGWVLTDFAFIEHSFGLSVAGYDR
jgi:formate hydrogenlyase subunit 5